MSNKKELSERDICTQFILPALVKSGWDIERQVREEVFFTDGRIFVKGNKTTRGKRKRADLFLILMVRYLKDGGRAGIVLPDGSLTGDGVKQCIRQHVLENCNLHTIVRLPNSVFQPYASVATNLLFFEKGNPTKEIWYWEHKLPEGAKSYSKTKLIQKSEFDGLKKWWKKRKENEQAWKASIDTIAANGYNLDIKNPHTPEEKHTYTSAELVTMIHESFRKSDELLQQLRKELENG